MALAAGRRGPDFHSRGVTGPDLFLRVELGSIAGAAASAAMMASMLIPRMREGVGADSLTELVEQIEHEPLEI